MTQQQTSTPLLIANEFHSDTIQKLDSLFDTYKLWLLPLADQQKLITDLKPRCNAVASASWQTNPLIYELPALEIISCFGVGVDGIDFEITRARGISVTNTPNVLNDAVADIAMALILMTQRNLINADRFVRNGSWTDGPLPLSHDLSGKTLGILGLGSIGEDIAQRALASKMKIAYHNRNQKHCPYTYYPTVNELARNSDILLCTLPGGEETANIINKDVFNELGPTGTFINVGRGSSVNENDLIAALKTGTIAAAGLDVYQKEPEIPAELLSTDNVVLLPHIGSATVETRQSMGNLVVENLLAWRGNKSLLTPIS